MSALSATKVSVIQQGSFDNQVLDSVRFPEITREFQQNTPELVPYLMLKEAFKKLGFDEANSNSEHWNPLGEIISAGDTVLIKPNLIRQSHISYDEQWEHVITSGTLISAVVDYVYLALDGKGRIIIADGPQTDSDFDEICNRLGLHELVERFRKKDFNISLLDLRQDRWFEKDDVIHKRIKLPGDPAGYTTVDLAKNSEFQTYALSGKFYGADYNIEETASFHSDGHHTYIMSRSVMDADVIINLPKLKTHKKTGVTLSLKNMVGVNGHRNCLPHHTIGTPDQGGDEFPDTDYAHKLQSKGNLVFKKVLVRFGGRGGVWARMARRIGRLIFGDTKKVIRSGNWHGNDTIWRMVLDLNKILFHFNGSGNHRSSPLKYVSIIDGLVAGDGDGPVSPDRVDAGLIIVGCNPVAVDTVATIIMGFDYQHIPVVINAWEIGEYSLVDFKLEEVFCLSNQADWNGSIKELANAPHLGFQPHFGWIGKIERN